VVVLNAVGSVLSILKYRQRRACAAAGQNGQWSLHKEVVIQELRLPLPPAPSSPCLRVLSTTPQHPAQLPPPPLAPTCGLHVLPLIASQLAG
jgi:hypothetical protein